MVQRYGPTSTNRIVETILAQRGISFTDTSADTDGTPILDMPVSKVSISSSVTA